MISLEEYENSKSIIQQYEYEQRLLQQKVYINLNNGFYAVARRTDKPNYYWIDDGDGKMNHHFTSGSEDVYTTKQSFMKTRYAGIED
jgi:hypothetical protein